MPIPTPVRSLSVTQTGHLFYVTQEQTVNFPVPAKSEGSGLCTNWRMYLERVSRRRRQQMRLTSFSQGMFQLSGEVGRQQF